MSLRNVFSNDDLERMIPHLQALQQAFSSPAAQSATDAAEADKKKIIDEWLASQQRPKAAPAAAPAGVDPQQFQQFLEWQKKQQAPTPTPAPTPAPTPVATTSDDVDLDKTYSLLEKIMGPNNVPAKVRSKFAERAFTDYKTKIGDTDSSITFDTFKKQFKRTKAVEGSAKRATPDTPVQAPPATEKKQRVDQAALTSTVLNTVGV